MDTQQQEFSFFQDPAAPPGEIRCPGDFIKDELRRRGWSQQELARIINRPLPTVNEIIKGKRGVTPDMAISLGAAFGNNAELWVHREAAFRLNLAKIGADTTDTSEKAKLFEIAPIKDMQKRGWLSKAAKSAIELKAGLDNFFNNDVTATLRQSTAKNISSNAQKAWVCKAAEMARRVNARPYSQQNFTEALSKLRWHAKSPERAAMLPIFLAELGVRLVVVETLPKAKIDGAAFFLDEDSSKPVIALSLRIDRMESVWHTLSHEVQHILNQDPLSIDSDLSSEDSEPQNEIEERADRLAAEWQIPQDSLKSFIVRSGGKFPKEKINQFANRMAIHPSIVIGQLHHLGALPWSQRNEMCPKIREHILATALSDGFGKQI